MVIWVLNTKSCRIRLYGKTVGVKNIFFAGHQAFPARRIAQETLLPTGSSGAAPAAQSPELTGCAAALIVAAPSLRRVAGVRAEEPWRCKHG